VTSLRQRMSDDEIDNAARQMLTEIVLRHLQPGTDQWHKILAWRSPEARLTDREYITMRAVELIEERAQKR
jgi:hypothetical protein